MIPFDRVMTLVREVDAAGRCSHPIRLTGITSNALTGEVRTRTVKVPCKDRRAAVCASCSALYQTDAWILVASGMNGGKGVPQDVASHPMLFATLTAPSFGPVHCRSIEGRPCRPRRAHDCCGHRGASGCELVHDDSDAVLGAPLCPSCMDARSAVLWNAMASALWDRTMVRLRRTLAMEAGLPSISLGQVAHVEFLKVAEVQRRGLVHFHIVLRADGSRGPETEPPEWLTVARLAESFVSAVRTVQVADPLGGAHRWGRELDVSEIDTRASDDRRVASYVAKYATKTTDGSAALAHRFASRGSIQHAKVCRTPSTARTRRVGPRPRTRTQATSVATPRQRPRIYGPARHEVARVLDHIHAPSHGKSGVSLEGDRRRPGPRHVRVHRSWL